jgi:hypothetical protein
MSDIREIERGAQLLNGDVVATGHHRVEGGVNIRMSLAVSPDRLPERDVERRRARHDGILQPHPRREILAGNELS